MMNHQLRLIMIALLLPLAARAGDAAYLFSCAPVAACVEMGKGSSCGKWELAKLGWVRAGRDGCTLRSVRYDAGRRLFWAVAAGEAPAYSVVAFTLDPPRLVHRIRLEGRLEAAPNLVVPPVGERLWLAYQMESGSQIAAIPIGAAESAVKLPAAPALQAKQELTWFSPYAEWSANGISDLLKRVSLEGQAVRVQAVEPKPAGGCTEPVVAYAARGGKVLLHSPARQKPGTCVEWFDPLSSRRTMALLPGPLELRHVAIAPDGQQALLWSGGTLSKLELSSGKLSARATWKPETVKSSAVAFVANDGAALLRDGYKLTLLSATGVLEPLSGVRTDGQAEYVAAPAARPAK